MPSSFQALPLEDFQAEGIVLDSGSVRQGLNVKHPCNPRIVPRRCSRNDRPEIVYWRYHLVLALASCLLSRLCTQ
jgi:hypothetical protein